MMKSLLPTIIAAGSIGVNFGQLPQETNLRLELFVDNIEESIEFYTAVLGFEKLAGGPTYVPVKNGATVFGLGLTKSLSKSHYFNPQLQDQRRGLGAEIVLEVEDVSQYFERVKNSGHPILSPLVRRPWGQTDFRLADPDGYYLRITSKD